MIFLAASLLVRLLTFIMFFAGAVTTIAAAMAVINKTSVGRWFKLAWKRLYSDPAQDRFANTVSSVMSPQLEQLRADAARLEEKNDLQHGENKQAIVDMAMTVEGIKYLLENTNRAHEVQVESILASIRTIRQLYTQHMVEAQIRDDRLGQIEHDLEHRREVHDNG